MTIREALETVDRLKPNQYGSADKLRWLSELDGAVYREILTQHEMDVPAFAGYTPEADLDGTVLLIAWPYDEIYRWYLEMKIDDANGEMTKYNNSAAKLEMSRNVQSGNTQNLKSSAAPVRLPAAPASTPGTSQAAAQAGCVYRP